MTTMSSIFNSGPSSFFRSRSSPNIPELAKAEPQVTLTPKNNKNNLPRAASYTYLPTAAGQSAGGGSGPTTADDVYTIEDGGGAGDKREGRKGEKSTTEEPRALSVNRRKSLVARPKSWMQKARGSGTPERVEEVSALTVAVTAAVTPALPAVPKAVRENRRKSVSESLATFARKSWMGSSRSPSPSRSASTTSLKQLAKQEGVEGQKLGEKPTLDRTASSKTTGSPQKPQPVRQSTLQKLKRPQSVLMTFTNLTSANSSTSSLPSSLENKSTPRTSIEKVPPMPKTFSTEKLLHGLDGHRKRDELWAAFRSLDNDFAKFQSKSWSLKTNIVRSAVLPFLRNHASHHSNHHLRAEDLEKRVAVLNKWWAGLLEVLDGRQHNQTVSGVDRPVLLEACYCIMVRPEWRATSSPLPALSKGGSQSPTRPSLHTQKSTISVQSTGSQFIAESIYHNTRMLFIQNLLAQAAFVVEKMSLRHAPASLTTFCGKAMAYAFFFVPGVADVLVRVWKLKAETLRRVVEELGLPLRADLAATEEVSAAFPSHLSSLGWSSPKTMAASLRRNAQLSIMAGNVKWFGPWTARWCGRDSDLFFVFVKHYFILCEEFLIPDLPLTTKCRAPGFILVQAQLIIALDGTTHRQQPPEALPITFDDVLGGADAIAAALPLPSNNTARPMAENRLIMLPRDFLSEHSAEFGAARTTFAEVFSKTVQASAHNTSLYDHHACFVLCDFLEETLQIFIRFQLANPAEPDHIDWFFWLEVCKKVLESQNTMSEIRLFALVYGSWNTLVANECRKETITLQWLLMEETFMKFFCHWCPMVRAYYMRLLCWRLCRDDGDASALDTKIFSTVSTRLKMVFSYYLFLKQVANDSNMQSLSTIPCHPAPGRRFLIIRNDFQAPTANLFLGFDGIIPPTNNMPTPHSTPFKRHSTQFAPPLDIPAGDASPSKDKKKRWSILGKSSNGEGSSPASSPSVTPSSSPPRDLDEVRRETANSRASRPSLQRASSSATRTRSEPPASYRLFCFKFSLEWAQNFERNNGRANQERRIVSPRLPSPAQACIGARVPGTGREVKPLDPGSQMEGVKYAGRALSEWAVIVGECNSFVERRRSEGVPGLRLVEVPVLGVEGFRKFGG